MGSSLPSPTPCTNSPASLLSGRMPVFLCVKLWSSSSREDSCHLSPSCFPRRLLMSAIMNWKLRVSAMFCVITTSPKTRDQKQETFIIILWSCALVAQGSWPGRVWLLHALLAAVALYLLGQWQWHGHQDPRPPGFCTCSKLQGSPEQPDRKQAPVYEHIVLKQTLLFSTVLCPQWNWTENREGSHRPLSLFSLQYYQQPLLLLLSHFSGVRLCATP